MSVVIRLARAGTKKRPVYHVVVADLRFPRDGRFIERLGHFNPLLPKENEARLKLDMDKVKVWIAKGAQPSDRVIALPRCGRRRQAHAAQQPGTGRAAQGAQGQRRSRCCGRCSRRQEVIAAARGDGGTHLRRPNRRRAWRARRGEAVDLHRRSAGGDELRPAQRPRTARANSRWRTPAKPRIIWWRR